MKMPYGYNDDGTINPTEAENIRFLYEKLNEYSENPPAELVEMTRKEMEARTDRKTTYEEVKEHVSYSQINYVCKEINKRIQAQMPPEEYLMAEKELYADRVPCQPRRYFSK